jgi:hypothetical protein
MKQQNKSYLESINEEVVEGILEGVRQGVAHGIESGAGDGLKECFKGGVIDIRQEDIGDVLEDVREGSVTNKVSEYAKVAFEKSIEGYIAEACQDLVDSIKREHIRMSDEQEGQVLEIFIKREREAMQQIVRRLPDNPLMKEITAGIQGAVEEDMTRGFRANIRAAAKGDNAVESIIRGMAKESKPRKDVRSPVSYLIKETISDVVYKIAGMSTKRIVKELKNERKDEFIYKLEGSRREALQPGLREQLNERTRQMSKEILQNSADRVGFIRGLERSFEQGFREYLLNKPIKRGRSRAIVIAVVCFAVIVAGGILSRPYWSGNSTPPPGSVSDSQQNQIPMPENMKNAIITLERTPCFGSCPVYKLTVYGTGRVVYEGTKNVNVVGNRESTLSNEQIMALIERFIGIDYFSLNDSYQAFMVSDMPSAITSMQMDGKMKTVQHYHGDKTAPEVLTELEDFIDQTVNSAQWTG